RHLTDANNGDLTGTAGMVSGTRPGGLYAAVLSDVGVGAGFADHGAAGDGPAGHAVGDVDRVPPGTGQRLRGVARARASAADHVPLAVARDLVDTRGDIAEPHVNGVRRVPGRPLVVLAHVEQEDPGRQVRRHHLGLGILGLEHDRSPLRLRGEYCSYNTKGSRETRIRAANERWAGRPRPVP